MHSILYVYLGTLDYIEYTEVVNTSVIKEEKWVDATAAGRRCSSSAISQENKTA